MKFLHLLKESSIRFDLNKSNEKVMVNRNLFDLGAKWMFAKMNENNKSPYFKFDDSISFTKFGILKYGLSILGSITYLYIAGSYLFLPIAFVLFYVIEIHFLFLFPLLIDKVDNPLISSIKQTYKIGFLSVLFNVIPIGFYMMIGLLNFKMPYRNWYIGCLSIIIWYNNEVRNRV